MYDNDDIYIYRKYRQCRQYRHRKDNTPTVLVAWREYFVIRLHCAAWGNSLLRSVRSGGDPFHPIYVWSGSKRDRIFSVFVKIFLERALDLSNRCSYNNRTKQDKNESGGGSGAGAISRD